MECPVKFSDYDPLQGQILQVLNPEGDTDPALLPELGDEVFKDIFRQMLTARVADRHLVILQREGRLGTFAPIEGQEACQVGSVLPLVQGDWIVPTFRELAAMLGRGVPLEKILLFWMGNEEGNRLPKSLGVLPIAVPVASQIVHSVGMGMAFRHQRKKNAVVCYFGDGATSEGDFHEAMTFAGVTRAPVIFFCQNNAWAISVPREIQCAADSLAKKAVGYGMPGIQIDGNDPFATYLAVSAGLERARSGDGPCFIEALTYRLGPHTTSDDPHRYRSRKEEERMRALEPLSRYRAFLERRGLWTEEEEMKLTAELESWIDGEVTKAESRPAPGPDDIFDFHFASLPPGLARQKAELEAWLRGDA